MRAAICNGKVRTAVQDRPKPEMHAATDAVVRVARACGCGSDLWFYRGTSGPC